MQTANLAQVLLADAERWHQAKFAALDELKDEAVKVVGIRSAQRWRRDVQKLTWEIYSRLN